MSQPAFFEAYGGSGPENYERYFVPAIGRPMANDLVESAALRPGERVLDIACGTGAVSRLAAERVKPDGSVVGLDINPGMIEVARSVASSEVDMAWQTGSAESMPLPDNEFDVVLCQLGLQFMADKTAALEEMHRVLKPDGRLILSVAGPSPEPFVAMADALAQHIGPQAGAFVGMVFSLHDPEEVQALFSDAGFRGVEIETNTPTLRLPKPEEFLWQYVSSTPLAERVAQANDDTRAAVERDVVSAWQPYTENGASLIAVPVVTATART